MTAQEASSVPDVTREQELERQRDEFLSTVAHDLKTPLTTIKGFVQLLERKLDREGVLHREQALPELQRVSRTVDAMTELIGQLLDVTRLQTGKELELNPMEQNLTALVNNAIEAHRQAFEDHEILVEGSDPELIGWWDGSRIERVVLNLLANAATYSAEESAVRVILRREGPWAVLGVADQGIGIPSRDHPHVFDRFFRGSNVTGRIEGAGIGLAIVKQIVEQHGGSVDVESTEGVGTTVTVRLPIGSES